MKTTKIEAFIIVVGLVLLASISYNLGLSTILLSGIKNGPLAYLYSIVISMPLGFMLLPYLIAKNKSLFSERYNISFNPTIAVILAAILVIADLVYFKTGESLNQLVIATSEEFLFRYVIFRILQKDMSLLQTIVVNSLIFALVLHLNYSLVDNLLLRFPFSVALSYISYKFGLQYSIASHWLYNLVVVKFNI